MIHSRPFPMTGVHYCPCLQDAENLLRSAIACRQPLADFADVFEKDVWILLQRVEQNDLTMGLGDLTPLTTGFLIQTGIGVAKLRSRIASLWQRVSSETMIHFLKRQLLDADDYRDE